MRANMQAQLERGTKKLSLALDAGQTTQLLDFLELVVKWNRTYNLTAVNSPADMVSRHLLDSLTLLPHIRGERVLDIGTGAGLPGIPLAIALPQTKFVLLDSAGKKVRFLNHVIRTLKLRNAVTVHSRIESFQPEVSPDTITARAVATLPGIINWCDHMMGPDTCLLAMKGRYPEQELLALPAGFMIDDVIMLAVPGESAERHLARVRREARRDTCKKK